MRSESDTKENLGKFPGTLEAAYTQIYEEIDQEPGNGSQMAYAGLRLVLVFPSLLHPSEWLDATIWTCGAGENFPLKLDFQLSSLLDVCHNLVVEDKQTNTIQFSHLLVREYLESLSQFRIPKPHTIVAQACLTILSSQASLLAIENEPLDTRLIYAMFCWVHHLNRSNPQYKRPRTLKLIKEFLGTPREPTKAYLNQAKYYDHYFMESISIAIEYPKKDSETRSLMFVTIFTAKFMEIHGP